MNSKEEELLYQRNQDIAVGKCQRGTKKDKTPAKYFNIFIFELDPKTLKPKITGKVVRNGKEYDKHKIIRVFKIPESTLLKVATDKQKSCNIYWRPPRR